MTQQSRSSRTIRRPWVFAFCLSCLLAVAPAYADHRPSTREMKAMSRQAADARVRDDLLSILEPSGKISPGNFRELHFVALKTRAFGTEFDGVCRRDVVELHYTGVVPGEASDRKPMRPYSIEAHPVFHILHLPKIGKDVEHQGASPVDQAACPDIDKAWRKRARADREELAPWETAQWMSAEDALQAVRAGFMVEMAVAAVRSGTLKPEPCDAFAQRDGKTCEEGVLEAGGVSDIGSVESCPAPAGSICYDMMFPDSSVELMITARGDAATPVPESIESISIFRYITVT